MAELSQREPHHLQDRLLPLSLAMPLLPTFFLVSTCQPPPPSTCEYPPVSRDNSSWYREEGNLPTPLDWQRSSIAPPVHQGGEVVSCSSVSLGRTVVPVMGTIAACCLLQKTEEQCCFSCLSWGGGKLVGCLPACLGGKAFISGKGWTGACCLSLP